MYSRNKDLVIVSFFGFIYYAIVIGLSNNLTQIPLGEYFLLPFIVAILMSFSIRHPEQMIEWPLCFLFGGTIGAINIIIVLSFLGVDFSFYKIAHTLSHTFAWFGVISSMILIGILIGAFLKATYHIVMGSLDISFE
jgi:hypothetical protein